ncbi:uncharacterized protein V1513DRAFT_435378 [Lipomyces chichibuensis]|uniref:uncharacterized protein n=1 Tax=Lipomyces chichibuensis TaxID=1546026 RepID=UPI003342F352
MASSRKVYKAISSLYRRAVDTARHVREAFEDGWPPGRQNGGGGGGGGFIGRRQPIPVRVPIPVPHSPYPRPTSRPGSQSWYSNTSRRFASTSAFSSRAFQQQVHHANKYDPPRFMSVAAKLSNIGHGTTFAHPFLSPKWTGGTLSRSLQGYSLPGLRSRGSVRYFCFNVRPMANVITNLSASARAGGFESSKLVSKGVKGRKFTSIGINQYDLPMSSDVDTLSSTDSRGNFYFICNAPALECSESNVGDVYDPAAIKTALNTTFLEFDLSPTFTFSTVYAELTENVVDSITESVDRHIADLNRVVADVKAIANTIGSLQLSLRNDNGTVFRVHFSDRTPDQVERICKDLGITRGMIRFDSERSRFRQRGSQSASEHWSEDSFSDALFDSASLSNRSLWNQHELPRSLNQSVLRSEYSYPDGTEIWT